MRESRPDSGLGVQVKVLKTFEVVPSCSEAARQATSGNLPQVNSEVWGRITPKVNPANRNNVGSVPRNHFSEKRRILKSLLAIWRAAVERIRHT